MRAFSGDAVCRLAIAMTHSVGLALMACGSPDARREDELRPEVGFVDLPADIVTVDGTSLDSPATRIFYALRPARVAPEHAPLIVLHSGGPSGSVMFVLAYGTGARTIGPSGALEDNAAALADAHLVCLDVRQAGFSYGELDDPADFAARDHGVLPVLVTAGVRSDWNAGPRVPTRTPRVYHAG
jgi:hypothetical protein